MSFRLLVHPGCRPWVPEKEDRKILQSAFDLPEVEVHLWPRPLIPHVIERPTLPYSFRAFSHDGRSHLFVDSTETKKSIAWLMAHELCHQRILQESSIRKHLLDQRPPLDPAGDSFHELDPEETTCDEIATKLLGIRLDRSWWRQRTLKG
jgi:hypothetical protein